jgi:PPK2 family polyphosphate:nucleotide phosphotransferase
MGKTVRETFRVPAEPASAADLAKIDPRSRPIGPKDKAKSAKDMADLADRLDHLQEALYAEATAGSPRAVLLVLQGMDTSGKGGVIRHVGGLVNPQGLQIATFKKPTEEELAHDFLWRVRRHVPVPGRIGIFDRSHYEDVLIVRVHDLVAEEEWRRRYGQINRFEEELADFGVTVVKCLLHISYDYQRERLLARLDDPVKRWKFSEADVEERRHWPAYQEAYADAVRHCSGAAPWYVVPADRKWYRKWALARILRETLTEMGPEYPPRDDDLDVDAVRRRLIRS